jgi:uncharacterized DUF497 family protein
MRFEYDPAKSDANHEKHGIDFDEAQALWEDDGLLLLRSRNHVDEERWLAIGRIDRKHWTAIITMRGTAIRLISVRRARKEERDVYQGD